MVGRTRERGVLPLVSVENELFSAKMLRRRCLLVSLRTSPGACALRQKLQRAHGKPGKPSPSHSNGGLMRKVPSGSDL